MWNICRTCMRTEGYMISIFNQRMGPPINIMLTAISHLKVSSNDALPSQICITCLNTLQTTYYFKEQVLSCNNALQKQVQTSNSVLLQVNEEVKQEPKDKGNEYATSVDADEKLSQGKFAFNDNDAPSQCSSAEIDMESIKLELSFSSTELHCNDVPEENFSGCMQDIDFPFDGTCITSEEVEENSLPSEYKCEITKSVTSKNEPNVEVSSEGDLLCLRMTESCINAQDVEENSNGHRNCIESHINNINNKSRKCNVTKKTSKRLKKRNAKSLNSGKPYKCTYCNKLFNLKRTLASHVQKHTDPHTCELCGDTFSWPSHLKIHMRNHTVDSPFVCQHCNAPFNKVVNLNRHIRKHISGTTSALHKCGICWETFSQPSLLIEHMEMHTDGRPYKCQYCNAGFWQSTGLNRHIHVHADEAAPKPKKNEISQMRCSDPNRLKMCKKNHTDERPFAQSGDMIKHNRTHTGAATLKSHKCEVCGKIFSWASSLKMHMKTHTGERHYCCDYCNARFVRPCNLERHIRTHTNESTKAC